jgi:alpha-L-fucosidase 2
VAVLVAILRAGRARPRQLAALALAAALGGACTSGQRAQPGPDGGAATGAAGTSAPGSAGNGASGSGVAGDTGGLAGSAGAAGLAGAAGSGGVTGAAGSTGAAGAGSAAGASGAAGMGPTTNVVDGPTGQAFNPVTGMLNVDYGAYLSKHDVVYNQPNTNPLYGLTVGNGRLGAIVWSENGLTMQVSGVDTSQQTALSAGLVNLSTTPALDAGATKFQQRLSLYDGLLATTYDTGRTVTVLGAPNSEVIGIHVADSRANVASIALDLSLWDLTALKNAGNVPDLNTWKTVITYADASGAGLSRGQTDPNHFGYTLAATVEGTAFTTQMVSGSKVRLTITPGASYTIWIACASRLNAPNNDSVTQAKALLAQSKAAGYAATLASYQAFWHGFWGKSFVQYSNTGGDADFLENEYYLATSMIAAGAYGNYPFHFINGVFRATKDDTKWSNAYWYWNQRDVYNSFLASNHPEVLSVFNRMYSRNFDVLKAFTMTRYGIDGIWVPETMGWNGNADGTVGSDYTKNIYSTGTEAALNMYAQYAYTNDADYLKNTVYPFMREVVKFYAKKLSKDAAGKYYMELSNAHETYWNVKNAITDLAAVRSLFPIAIRTSQALALDATLRSEWQTVLDNLVAYPTDGTSYLGHQPPLSQTRNGENVAAELIWPYNVTGLDAPDYQMAVSTWKTRPNPYSNVWANDAIQAARLGLGDEANQGMKLMLQRYANYPNAMTNNTNGVFEYLGVHLVAMNESLLQSYNDKIRVFPAFPKDASLVTRFTLAAQGGFLVTSEREGGDIKYVGIKSLWGNTATVINPWGTMEARVRKLSDGSNATMAAAASLKFDTVPGAIYVIERTAKPLTSYTYAYLTGTPNQDAKHLSPTCVLGIAR